MATEKQKNAAKKSIKKAQAVWKNMTTRMREAVQPEGRARKEPGTGGSGRYYRIEVKPRSAFTAFRTQDVGQEGHLQRIAGKRPSGRWDTATWLVSKEDAHIGKNDQLVIDNRKIRDSLKKLKGKIFHAKGNIFRLSPAQ